VEFLADGGTSCWQWHFLQQIAAPESARTAKLYDRTNDQVRLDEIEKVMICRPDQCSQPLLLDF
jgi:hypothetical protein